jgi:hypothetical protein
MLKNHANLSAYGSHILGVLIEFNTIDNNASLVMLFQAVDAADQRGLARSRRAAYHHALTTPDAQVHVLQDMQITKPLVHAIELDDVRFHRLGHVI